MESSPGRRVYLLWHESEVDDPTEGDIEIVTLLGCFFDLDRARDEQRAAECLPFFGGAGGTFKTDEYTIGEIDRTWLEGFSSWR